MATPAEILDVALQQAETQGTASFIDDPAIASRIELVCRNLQNRAGVRLLMAALVAKIHRPHIDIRKPYTEIGGGDTYSGRGYDEAEIGPFITSHRLPANATTAFLTPALRNRAIVLTPDVNLVGRPKPLYQAVLQLLTDVHTGQASAELVLAETLRQLVLLRDERLQRMASLLASLKHSDEGTVQAAETIINLLQQHLSLPGTSRLLTLIVAAAYQVADNYLGERVLPLHSHNAADSQTGALGDLDITLVGDNGIITSYEMKARRVMIADIDLALQKISARGGRVQNYIFITTLPIDKEVKEYAATIYQRTNGIEVVILDCISFIRHFLHLFYRLRMQYLETYQALMLAEPDSTVSQPLKEAFLALRQATESDELADPETETSPEVVRPSFIGPTGPGYQQARFLLSAMSPTDAARILAVPIDLHEFIQINRLELTEDDIRELQSIFRA